jgi:hypothetical protein
MGANIQYNNFNTTAVGHDQTTVSGDHASLSIDHHTAT